MGAQSRITPQALRLAVLEAFFRKSVEEETKVQGRPLTKNEETAFRRGMKYGVNFDLFQDGDWEAAAATLEANGEKRQ